MRAARALGLAHGRRVLRRRPRRAARPRSPTRRVRIGPAPARESLPRRSTAILDAARRDRRRGDPSRLRLPVGERGASRGVRRRPGSSSSARRRTSSSAWAARTRPRRAARSRPACPWCPAIDGDALGRRDARRARGRRGRLPAAGQGGRGRRRQGHADRRRARPTSPTRSPPRRREARGAFGDDTLLVERYVERARHVEIQVLADAHGTVVHLVRARLLAAAPPPEGARGGARAGDLRRGRARRCASAAVAAGARGRLRQRRARSSSSSPATDALLLHGDEHAAAGRASGHRDDHRPRPRRAGSCASPRASRCRSRQDDVTPRGHAIEARDLRRGPGARASCPQAGRRDVRALVAAGAGRRRARGRPGGRHLVRPDARQGHRPRRHARGGPPRARRRARRHGDLRASRRTSASSATSSPPTRSGDAAIDTGWLDRTPDAADPDARRRRSRAVRGRVGAAAAARGRRAGRSVRGRTTAGA